MFLPTTLGAELPSPPVHTGVEEGDGGLPLLLRGEKVHAAGLTLPLLSLSSELTVENVSNPPPVRCVNSHRLSSQEFESRRGGPGWFVPVPGPEEWASPTTHPLSWQRGSAPQTSLLSQMPANMRLFGPSFPHPLELNGPAASIALWRGPVGHHSFP